MIGFPPGARGNDMLGFYNAKCTDVKMYLELLIGFPPGACGNDILGFYNAKCTDVKM